MIGEIIAIGDELTSGRILNTTSNFAAARLFTAGHEIIAMTTIGDDPGLIGKTLLQSLARSDFAVVTGGLGATTDDLTNEAVASALDRPSTFYPEILRQIQHNSKDTPEKVRSSLEKLAWLPAGAHSLKAESRSAGYFLVHEGKPVFFLPGVPQEMEELLVETVISRLSVWEGKEVRKVRQRIYRVMDLAETEINSKLKHIEDGNAGRVFIGYYPVFPEVQVSLTVTGDDNEETAALFKDLDRQVRELLGVNIYGTDTQSLAEVVGSLLKEKNARLALAESCTGGLIASRITAVAGSSGFFTGAVVVYSNELKEKVLGVQNATLVAHGAVSAQTAGEMVEGVRRISGADYALSITGIAGPGGGSLAKPVGTVYIGLGSPAGTDVSLHNFSGNRQQVRKAAGQKALNILRLHLLGR